MRFNPDYPTVSQTLDSDVVRAAQQQLIDNSPYSGPQSPLLGSREHKPIDWSQSETSPLYSVFVVVPNIFRSRDDVIAYALVDCGLSRKDALSLAFTSEELGYQVHIELS